LVFFRSNINKDKKVRKRKRKKRKKEIRTNCWSKQNFKRKHAQRREKNLPGAHKRANLEVPFGSSAIRTKKKMRGKKGHFSHFIHNQD
jgi:hypothetical protein